MHFKIYIKVLHRETKWMRISEANVEAVKIALMHLL